MKKLYIFLILGILFAASGAQATVGGPTFIYEFKYNPANESVYYILNSQSGRGCPPELLKISLNTGKSTVVFSCDQGEKLVEGNGYDFSIVNSKINSMIENFKNLTPINLKKNKIAVDISLVNYENIAPDVPEIKNANFLASVYQDGKKINEFPITGCNTEQPFLFAGYSIPGFEKKIVLLLSAKGDCWEGGYIYESLHVVPGVNNLDKTPINFYKGSEALVPNEGTLVVYESENPIAPNSVSVPSKGGHKGETIYAVVAIILGLVLGYILGRKKTL